MNFFETSESAIATERRQKARKGAIQRKIAREIKATKGCVHYGRMVSRTTAAMWRMINRSKSNATGARSTRIGRSESPTNKTCRN